MSTPFPPSRNSAAVLTPAGRGAVAVIRVVASVQALDAALAAVFSATNKKSLSQQPLGAIRFGHWGIGVTEDVVICRVSDDVLEINCHGGDAAVNRIFSDLAEAGILTSTWPAQRQQQTSFIEVECTLAITRATTRKTALRLLEQRELWLSAAEDWRDLAQAGLSAEREREPEGDGPSPPAPLPEGARGAIASELGSQIDRALQWADFGLHLTTPRRVVICGRPNVGKSTLINALLGYDRSIVFDQPGTTRDVVTGETAFNGWPVVLADTAGLRATSDAIEQAGIRLARQSLQEADCRLFLFDLSQPLNDDDAELLAEATARPRSLIVGNKCDVMSRVDPTRFASATTRLPDTALLISAANGTGIEALMQQLVATLVPQDPEPGTLIPITPRQVDLLIELRAASVREDHRICQRLIELLVNPGLDK